MTWILKNSSNDPGEMAWVVSPTSGIIEPFGETVVEVVAQTTGLNARERAYKAFSTSTRAMFVCAATRPSRWPSSSLSPPRCRQPTRIFKYSTRPLSKPRDSLCSASSRCVSRCCHAWHTYIPHHSSALHLVVVHCTPPALLTISVCLG